VSFQSIVSVVFHERRLQYVEKEQLDVWKLTRPGERIIDIGTTQHLSYFAKFWIPQESAILSCETVIECGSIEPVHWLI